MSVEGAPQQPDHHREPFGQTGVLQFAMPVLACASLILMIFSLFMWYRSHNLIDTISSEQAAASWRIRSIYGRIFVTYFPHAPRVDDVEGRWDYNTAPFFPVVRDGWRDSPWKRIGIQWGRTDVDQFGQEGYWLRVRWPFLAVVFALLPAARVMQVWSRRRRFALLTANACPECGYDLRASQNYCPECGRPVSRSG